MDESMQISHFHFFLRCYGYCVSPSLRGHYEIGRSGLSISQQVALDTDTDGDVYNSVYYLLH